MASETFQLRIADWDADLPAIRRVREDVFIVEQQVPVELEWDEQDSACLHVLAEAANRDVVGTGRMDLAGKIGRVAVLKALRGHGIGTAIVRQLIAEGRRIGHTEFYLHAQVDALAFYQRMGFRAEGEHFVEAGILHQLMRLEFEK